MKNITLFFISIFAILAASCNENNQVQDIEEKTNTQYDVQYVNQANIVIVRVEDGKRYGRWPNQWCEGTKRFSCWRWFPKDVLINNPNPYEFENYMQMEYVTHENQTRLALRVPQINAITEKIMLLFEYIKENNGLMIDEPMLIDEPIALEFLHSTRPVTIQPKFYPSIVEYDKYTGMPQLIIPIELGKP